MTKIKVSMENLFNSLFILGYDKVDSFLFMAVWGNLYFDYRDKKNNTFIYNNKEYNCELEFIKNNKLSKDFLFCVDDYFGGYKLINSNIMDTNVANIMEVDNINYLYGKCITTLNNQLLANYIDKNIDMNRVVVQKIANYGINNINNYSDIFCGKEKDMIVNIFGISSNNVKKLKR